VWAFPGMLAVEIPNVIPNGAACGGVNLLLFTNYVASCD